MNDEDILDGMQLSIAEGDPVPEDHPIRQLLIPHKFTGAIIVHMPYTHSGCTKKMVFKEGIHCSTTIYSFREDWETREP